MSRIAAARFLVATLKAIGLWEWRMDSSRLGNTRLPCRLKLQRIYGLILHIPFTFIYITLMTMAVLCSQNLEEISTVLHFLLTEFSLVVKISHIWQYSGAAWRYMAELANEPIYALRHQSEWTKWHRAQRTFAIIAYAYMLGSMSTTVFTCINATTTPADVYVLPYNYYVPFEWHHPRKYWYAYTYSCVGIILTCIANITLDMIFCYFMFHLSLLYKLIGWRLAALRRPKRIGGVDADEPEIIDQMSDIFRMHMNVKRYGIISTGQT